MPASDISDEELLRRAVTHAKPRHRRQVRWAVISELFSLGSTYSQELCARFDLDPDDEIKVR